MFIDTLSNVMISHIFITFFVVIMIMKIFAKTTTVFIFTFLLYKTPYLKTINRFVCRLSKIKHGICGGYTKNGKPCKSIGKYGGYCKRHGKRQD
jgi:hypothetical protein